MSGVRRTELPAGVLLHRYTGSGYTDCYVTEVDAVVTQPRFVQAFYTTPLFKVERALLAGAGFHALLGFHRLYSRLLLGAAQRRLQADEATA